MGREWAELSATISAVDATWKESPRLTHRTAVIARVHLWAAQHDRSTDWACETENWDARRRPAALPDQSTMSRRTRGEHGKRFHAFLDAVSVRLSQPQPQSQPLELIKIVDGKPLTVAAHSKDRGATWGRGAGGVARGYKLHAIVTPGRPMPLQWVVAPLNVDERAMAPRLIRRLGDRDGAAAGYVLGDANYDANHLYRHAAAANHQMLCPRRQSNRAGGKDAKTGKSKRPGGVAAGIGRRRQSPQRLRSVETLEPPTGVNRFGPEVQRLRRGIETTFGNLTAFGGGLQGLPSWVRRPWRVRNWVYAKLLINACRIRRLKRSRA